MNLMKLKNKFKLYAVAGQTGLKAKYIADKYEAAYATTKYDEILQDDAIDLVMICTRHDTHADLVLRSLRSGKHVFVEKPLAVKPEELDAITSFYNSHNGAQDNVPLLMVGFNRRFSPYNTVIKKVVDNRSNPLIIRYRMNAGYLPPDHWVFDQGGRIIGEACHIIDLMTYLTGSKIKSIYSESIIPSTEKYQREDNKTIVLQYEDGSICSLDYFSSGHAALPKEYMEVHFDGKSIVMDDYQALKGYGVELETVKNPVSPKGHLAELEVLYSILREETTEWPIPFRDMVQTTEATFLV